MKMIINLGKETCDKMINIGIIGCGKIAQTRHLPEYSANKTCKIAGVFDLNFERAQEIAAQYGAVAYKTVEELLNNSNIDAVSVCVANNAHAEVTLKALQAGKHVLCEKPMATTIEDCEKMVRTAKEKGKYLMIGQNQRLTKAHVKAKELIQAGAIGKILTFRTVFGHGGPETWSVDPGVSSWFFDKKRAAMGAMADLGVHKTDLIQFLTDAKVVETKAVVKTLDKRGADGELIGVDDNAICIYTMDNGVIGTMTASWTYYGAEDNSTVLYGTKGIMKIYANPQFSIEIVPKEGGKILYDIDQIQTNDNQTKSGVIDEFIDALMNDREPIINGESVLAAMRAVFSSIESAEKNQTITVKQG